MIRPLVLGPLEAAGCTIIRSGVRWRKKNGAYCLPNDVFAFCNIAFQLNGAADFRATDFSDEHVQVGFALRAGGRVLTKENADDGGYLNILESQIWEPASSIADLEPDDHAGSPVNPDELRQIVLAGRRMTQLSDVHAGLLPGWLGRSRAWWCEGAETPITILSLGICDATSIILGEEGAFLDLFAKIPQATHVVFYPEHPVAPAVPVLLDQIYRTPSDLKAISSDIRKFMATTSTPPTSDDLIFAGVLLSALGRNPIIDKYKIFSGSGRKDIDPAQAILLSLAAEPLGILRHRKLGYHLQIMPHHRAAAGPAIRSWLASEFIVVDRSISDVRKDYELLIDQVSERTGAKLIVINRISTTGQEDVSHYAPFDKPLSRVLAKVEAKELNLMLHDLAEHRDLYIIDIDAIAAEMGAGRHVPDGIHFSGAMRSRLQAELAAILDLIRPPSDAASKSIK
jgi:hypothetical protein